MQYCSGGESLTACVKFGQVGNRIFNCFQGEDTGSKSSTRPSQSEWYTVNCDFMFFNSSTQQHKFPSLQAFHVTFDHHSDVTENLHFFFQESFLQLQEANFF